MSERSERDVTLFTLTGAPHGRTMIPTRDDRTVHQ